MNIVSLLDKRDDSNLESVKSQNRCQLNDWNWFYCTSSRLHHDQISGSEALNRQVAPGCLLFAGCTDNRTRFCFCHLRLHPTTNWSVFNKIHTSKLQLWVLSNYTLHCTLASLLSNCPLSGKLHRQLSRRRQTITAYDAWLHCGKVHPCDLICRRRSVAYAQINFSHTWISGGKRWASDGRYSTATEPLLISAPQ